MMPAPITREGTATAASGRLAPSPSRSAPWGELPRHRVRPARNGRRRCVYEPCSVEGFIATASELACGSTQAGGEPRGRRVAAEHAAGDHERRDRGHVRSGHRGAFVAGRQTESPRRGAGKGDLVDGAPGWLVGAAVGIARKAGVGTAARGDERESGAVVGVVGETAVFGGGADRDDIRGAGG